MLYRETGVNQFTEWRGGIDQLLDGAVLSAADVERYWTVAEREAKGLFVPFDPGVPEGYAATGRSVQRLEGVVRFVYDLVEAPASSYVPTTPTLCCMASLTVTDMEIGGIEVATGLGMALWVGPGQYWVFFSEAMPDYSYVAVAAASAGRANVSLRELDFMEITVVGDDGLPADPPEFSVQVYRLM